MKTDLVNILKLFTWKSMGTDVEIIFFVSQFGKEFESATHFNVEMWRTIVNCAICVFKLWFTNCEVISKSMTRAAISQSSRERFLGSNFEFNFPPNRSQSSRAFLEFRNFELSDEGSEFRTELVNWEPGSISAEVLSGFQNQVRRPLVDHRHVTSWFNQRITFAEPLEPFLRGFRRIRAVRRTVLEPILPGLLVKNFFSTFESLEFASGLHGHALELFEPWRA